MFTPPSLLVMEIAVIVLSARILARSLAKTSVSPPTWMSPGVTSPESGSGVKSINALAVLLTMLLAISPLVAMPVAPYNAEAAAVASLLSVASMVAEDSAVTDKSFPA